MNLRTCFALFLFCKLCIAEEDFRTWTSSGGLTLEAKFIRQISDDTIILNAKDGRELKIKKSQVLDADWRYVEEVELKKELLFSIPKPFDDKSKGAVIITSIKGKVEVIEDKQENSASNSKREVEVGEFFGEGAILFTDNQSEVTLLFTNGNVAKLGSSSKMLVSTFWQEELNKKNLQFNEITEELSPSRVYLNLDIGDLIVDVNKLSKSSSFIINTPLGVAGIRGTQFKVEFEDEESKLSVVEGKVSFYDSNRRINLVSENNKLNTSNTQKSRVSRLTNFDRQNIVNGIKKSIEKASSYDLDKISQIQIMGNAEKFINYSIDGTIIEEYYTRNGKKEGLHTKWYDERIKQYEVSYKNGLKTGSEKFWYKNGFLEQEWKFDKGQYVDGPYKTYWENGSLKGEYNFKNGKKNGLQSWFNSSGQKTSEANYLNGEIDGMLKTWYENGSKYRFSIYEKDQELESTWWYKSSSQIHRKTYSQDGLPHKILVWKRNGQKCTETNYVNGKGFVVKYNNNSPTKSFGYYDGGKLNGPVIYFGPNNELSSIRIYENGRPKERDQYELMEKIKNLDQKTLLEVIVPMWEKMKNN